MCVSAYTTNLLNSHVTTRHYSLAELWSGVTMCCVQMAFSRHSHNCMQQNPHLMDTDVTKYSMWDTLEFRNMKWEFHCMKKEKQGLCLSALNILFLCNTVLRPHKKTVKTTSNTARNQTSISIGHYVLPKCCAA